MEQYFDEVVNDLSFDHMNVLGHLFDAEATASFKAVRNTEVAEQCKLTEAMFRKTVNRLIGNKFIAVVILKRQHCLYITGFGIAALKKSLEEVSA